MGQESDNMSDRDFSSEDGEANDYSMESRIIKTKQFRCMIIGDLGVGKTSLLATYATGKFPGEHVPTVFGSYAGE